MKLKSLTIISLFAIGLSGLMSASAQSYNSGSTSSYNTGIPFSPDVFGDSSPAPIGVTVEAAYDKGKEQLEAGNYAEAEKLFRRVRRDYRSNAQVLEGLGIAHFGQADWQPAAAALRHSISIEPENHHARLLLSLSYIEMDQSKQASKHLAKFQSQIKACGDTCEPALIGAAAYLQDVIAAT